jgi:hypothetical protein
MQGFAIQCRKSQLKYNVPMRCLKQSLPHRHDDDAHETIEISSFCKNQKTTLNVRVIQVRIINFPEY